MTIREIVGEAKIAKGQYWSKTLTLVRGCTPVSEGCAHCWSAAMASRFPWGKGFAEGGKWTGKVEPNWKALEQLRVRAFKGLHTRKLNPQAFNIWNDLLHPSVPRGFMYNALGFMAESVRTNEDVFLILTKRANNIPHDFDATRNILFGVSVESQKHVHRIDKLIKAWPGRKFVSIEPALGSEYSNESVCLKSWIDQLDWVIIGSESGAHRRPCFELGELEKMIGICSDAGVPVFVKQWSIGGKFVKMPEIFGKHWDEMPEVRK